MMALTTTISMRAAASITKLIGDQTMALPPGLSLGVSLASGTGLNQADKVYYAKPQIAGSATLSLDFSGGTLKDPFGDAFTIVKLKVVVISCEAALCPNTINVLRPTAGVPLFLAASDGLAIPSGGFFAWAGPSLAAIAVTATTADLLDLVNTAAGTVEPEIFIIGTSA
jgi:hypothetical protein